MSFMAYPESSLCICIHRNGEHRYGEPHGCLHPGCSCRQFYPLAQYEGQMLPSLERLVEQLPVIWPVEKGRL